MNRPLTSAEFQAEIDNRFADLAADLKTILRRFDVLDRKLSQIEQNQSTIVDNQRVLGQAIEKLRDDADSDAELDRLDAERAAADRPLARGN